jgi:hypothetical protein
VCTPSFAGEVDIIDGTLCQGQGGVSGDRIQGAAVIGERLDLALQLRGRGADDESCDIPPLLRGAADAGHFQIRVKQTRSDTFSRSNTNPENILKHFLLP